MNPQMYIPVKVLLGHERLAALGATEEVVIAAASRSPKLGVDDQGTMVRPMLKSKRNVVILRELPVGTTEEEIRELLAGAPHADRIAHIKPEVNNTWFVKFNLDDGTQDVVLWLRSQLFKDRPINAAIKSEHFLRSFFPLHMASGGVPMPQMGYSMGDRLGMEGGPPPAAMMGAGPPPDLQGGVGGAPSWAEESAHMDLGGKGMLPMGAMGPPMMQVGLQGPGFWQPWGARHQPPPLVFSTETTLAAISMPVVAEQAAQMGPEILDNLVLEDDAAVNEPYDAGDKWVAKGKGKDRGKSSWKGGRDWGGGWKGGWGGGGSDWYASSGGKDKGGWGSESYGRNWGGWGGKEGGGKGWQGGGAPGYGGKASWAAAGGVEQAKGKWKGKVEEVAGKGESGKKGEGK
eukprot:CAMPEP_0115256602 /NCGR_PEP_ID=MMETSP0270-20121206/46335_1 /TAXON_ID=71861 /ORGANISM="Scrippsiella trochoidea, Strain CCMP3099" /LENGTH=401 /DNA_ID=CAMNT_0002672269 /DNA_START=26 /DNA_END=1228 /DNA_ORIENTATION=-